MDRKDAAARDLAVSLKRCLFTKVISVYGRHSHPMIVHVSLDDEIPVFPDSVDEI